MDLWISLINELMARGYKVDKEGRCIKHVEYPKCLIEGSIHKGVTPLCLVYEFLSLVELYGGKGNTDVGKSIFEIRNESHIDWIQNIGDYKIPTDIDMEVNIIPDSDKDVSVFIERGNVKCYLDLLDDKSYTALFEINTNLYRDTSTEALLIWEGEFDSVLNKGIRNILDDYFDSITVLSTKEDEYEMSDLSNVSIVLKINVMHYISRTLGVMISSKGESTFNDVLISDLSKYISEFYNETSKV